VILLISTAFAQTPQVFEPQVADLAIEGKPYSGILVDEATFAELGRLRVLQTEQAAKIAAYQDWESFTKNNFSTTLEAVREECDTGQSRLVAHYEQILKREKRRDFFQQHGFAIGMAAGLVGATGVYLGAVDFYGRVLER